MMMKSDQPKFRQRFLRSLIAGSLVLPLGVCAGEVTVPASERIESVGFIGYQGVDSAQLLALPEVQALNGKSVRDQAALRAATRALATYYRGLGFLVANAAVAKASGNEVEISIFEGVMTPVKVDNQSAYTDAQLKAYAGASLCDNSQSDCAGNILYTRRSERMTGIVSDLPGIDAVQLQLAPGAQVGSTQPTLRAGRGPDWTGYISTDNYGGQFTGRHRLTGGFIGNNWAGIGDQFVAEITGTDESGNLTGQLGYSLPVGYDGWRVGLSYARSEYLLGGEFEKLDSKGVSNTWTLYATYPVIRSQENNLTFRAAYDYGSSRSTILDIDQPRARSESFNMGLNGRFIDRWYGRSFTSYGATWSHGRITPKDSGFGGVVGDFDKWAYFANRDQELAQPQGGRLSFYAAVRGQEPKKHLDSGQRFSLGGPSGVRSYPNGEASGDRGTVGNLELRYGVYLAPYLPAYVTAAIFHDHGWKRDVDVASRNAKTLYGNGVSLNFSFADRYNLLLVWAKNGSGSPDAQTESNPSRERVWVQGTVSF